MKGKNPIIIKYLIRKILTNLFLFFSVLFLIIFGNQLFLVMNLSIKQGLLSSELLPLILLKTIRDTPFLIGLSFSLSIIYSLNKLYKSSELIVLNTAGIGDIKLFSHIKAIIFFITLIIFLLTAFIVPKVKTNIEIFKDNIDSRPDYVLLKQKTFQKFKDGNLVFYSKSVSDSDNSNEQILKQVFIFSENNEKVIIADGGIKKIDTKTGNIYLELKNGKIYENFNFLINTGGPTITNFEQFSIMLFEKKLSPSNFYNSVGYLPYHKLIRNENFKIKELLYRTSIPLSILIMSFISVVIAKTYSRQSRNFSLGYGLIIFIAYYNLIIYFESARVNDFASILINFSIIHLCFIILAIIIYRSKNLTLSLTK